MKPKTNVAFVKTFSDILKSDNSKISKPADNTTAEPNISIDQKKKATNQAVVNKVNKTNTKNKATNNVFELTKKKLNGPDP